MMKGIRLACILTAHKEGIMSGLTMRSFLDCIEFAENCGILIDKFIVLDKADNKTKNIFTDFPDPNVQVLHTEYGDQGMARNHAVTKVDADYVAFLDGDDLWGLHWLVEGLKICLTIPGKVIAHPQYNWFFDQHNGIVVQCDQKTPGFSVDFLRLQNYWDALCMTPTEIHRSHPYCERDIEEGFAFEDWHGNCETLAAGFEHHVAKGTIHFKRRRKLSQTIEASRKKTLMRNTDLLLYSWHEK